MGFNSGFKGLTKIWLALFLFQEVSKVSYVSVFIRERIMKEQEDRDRISACIQMNVCPITVSN